METYTEYEQEFGEGDVVIWGDMKCIVREVIQDEDGRYIYGVEPCNERDWRYEVPQNKLKGA